MPKTLSQNAFLEQIRIVCKVDDIEALTKTAQRISDLTNKKGYTIADTYIEDGIQNYYLEQKE